MKDVKRIPMVTKLKAKLANNPKVNLVNMNIPLSNGYETPKLRDILEESVDAKYYLRHEIVEKILSETDFTERLVSIKLEKKE
jgi:hypothetical protein